MKLKSSIYNKLILLLLLQPFYILNLNAQNWFFMPSFWEVGGPGMAFNIEAFDMNKDGHLDVVSGNWNDTYVYYCGPGILNTTVDVVYTGRMLAICDYNGDGFDDVIALHFTSFDSTREDYDGEILFYWGSDTTEIAIDTIPDYSIPLPTLYPTYERFTVGYFTVGIQKGDINGDGKIDLVFNSYNYLNPDPIIEVGGIYIYMGKEIPSDTADYILTGKPNGFPYRDYGAFFDVGDINGDGFDDLLISSSKHRTTGVTYDSISYLHIFYGSENFTAIVGNESEVYSSFVNPPDSTAGWFLRRFSVDDINGDEIDDLVVGRSFYNYPHITTVHYGSTNGIDTIPSFTFIQDTTMIEGFFSAGGVTQNIGDYNMDGYDDFIMSPAGYNQFALHFGGPNVSNGNRYGARGYSNAYGVFPWKGVNMGDQSNDGVNDIAVITGSFHPDVNGYILMLYGQNIPTDINVTKEEQLNFNLYQNYPNPFNPKTAIKYDLPKDGLVSLEIFDILGRKVAKIVNEYQSAGSYNHSFNASSFASGVYIYKLQAGDYLSSRKMILLK